MNRATAKPGPIHRDPLGQPAERVAAHLAVLLACVRVPAGIAAAADRGDGA